MKVLHILDHSLPLHSGYTFRSRSIFNAQKALHIEPVVVTSPKHEASWKGSKSLLEEIDGVRYYRSGSSSDKPGLPYWSEVRLMHRMKDRILEVARIERPHVIHAHSPVLNAFPALRASLELGTPAVYEIRAFWEDAAVDHGTYAQGSLKYRLVRALETRACSRADQVVVLCNGLKQDLLKRGIPASKVTAVFNGIDPSEFRPRPADEEYRDAWNLQGKTVVGFIGSFYHYEGLHLLLEAFSKLSASHPDVALLLVGGGETAEDLQRQVQELRLNGRVVFPGRVPHERIAGVYGLVDILVYPRYSMRLTELVTPLKPLEAMAMGKPLIASDIGGHRELIQHNKTGILFPPGNSIALRRELEGLLLNAALREDLGQQARSWVSQHQTWKSTTSVYPAIYDRALQLNRDRK